MPDPFCFNSSPRFRWLPLVLSVGSHAIVLFLLGLWWKSTTLGTATEPDRVIGVTAGKTLLDRTAFEFQRDQPSTAEDSTAFADGETARVVGIVGTAPMGIGVKSPLDLDALLADALATPLPNSGLATDASSSETRGVPGQSGHTKALSSDGGSKTKATLFGIEGYAHRFVYVMDRSDSMNGLGGRPLAAAKRELLRSLKSIGPDEEFQVIFYNERPVPLAASGQVVSILRGDRSSHLLVERAISMVSGSGGTNHMDALKMALRMSPNVVFLLTDARLPSLSRHQLSELHARASVNGTTIHTIEFGTDAETPPDSFLQFLAEGTGGEYRYFNVSGL